MDKKKVLFVCVHNSARSQMAETYLKALAGDYFHVESAGLTPGHLNPNVVEVMKEEGFDITKNSVDSVFDFFKEGRLYNYVISVCDESQAEVCPIFPGHPVRKHWSFEDPSALSGAPGNIKSKIRHIRDQIKDKVAEFIEETGP